MAEIDGVNPDDRLPAAFVATLAAPMRDNAEKPFWCLYVAKATVAVEMCAGNSVPK